MESSFEGILSKISKSNTVDYNPNGFSLKDLTSLFKQDHKNRECKVVCSPYMQAVIRNDKEQIAFYEKRIRVDKFRELKGLIDEWGISKAKVIAWLNKKNRNMSFTYSNRWRLSEYGLWEYRGIGKGEMESVSLSVKLDNGKFKITLHADDSDGYCDDVYTKVMAESISFGSIINVIKYISKRLENNAY